MLDKQKKLLAISVQINKNEGGEKFCALKSLLHTLQVATVFCCFRRTLYKGIMFEIVQITV